MACTSPSPKSGQLSSLGPPPLTPGMPARCRIWWVVMVTETTVWLSSSLEMIFVAWFDEGVVVEEEADAASAVACVGEAPEDVPVWVDEDHAIVAAVGDQQRPR
jgi:hypothetical protein